MRPADIRVRGYVLAGGASSRMGVDKATLEIFGKPLVERAADRMRLVARDVQICGDRPDLAHFAPILQDAAQNAGPLAALVPALEDALLQCPQTLAVVLAVDLPGVPWDLLQWLVQRARLTAAAATIPRVADRPQPLCAVYSAGLAPALRRSLDSGDHKVMRAVEQACTGEAVLDLFDLAATLGPPRSAAVEQWFLNVNTPDDLAQAEQALAARVVW